MELTQDEVERILKIIDQAEHVGEIDLSYGGFRLHLRRDGVPDRRGTEEMAPLAAPASVAAPVPAAASVSEAKAASGAAASPVPTIEIPDGITAVRAPILGTFYRAPAPGEKPFVEVGQSVKAGDTVCLIEVMKLFNSVKAGKDGRVARILVDNGGLVEFEQPLILIEPEN